MDDEADAGRIYMLKGRGLRFILVDQIRSRHTMTVAEMVAVLADYGYRLPGRASKVISDALRWELARGRVIRVARGVYAYGRAPQTTARRIRLFAERCETWIVAVMRGEEPPPTPSTPPHRRSGPWWPYEDPAWPPWLHLGWLWSA
ncbi:MAG: hypothetical protein ACRBK7_15590 [Acidimicrobiales bacterium]